MAAEGVESLTKSELIALIDLMRDKYGANEFIQGYVESVNTEKRSKLNSKQATKIVQLHSKKAKDNDFDMNNYRQRHIALQIQYDGGAYFGFASQVFTNKIECHFTSHCILYYVVFHWFYYI